MVDVTSYFYSTNGPLGVWTPAVAIILNIIGIGLGYAITKAVAYIFAPKYDLFKLPSPASSDPVLGHVKALTQRTDYHRVLLEWARECGSIFRIRLAHKHVVVITDPAAAAHVLTAVSGRPHSYFHVDEVLGGVGVHSMFGTPDEAHWRNVRKATAPAFAMANVRRYYAGVLTAAAELLSSLERGGGGGGGRKQGGGGGGKAAAAAAAEVGTAAAEVGRATAEGVAVAIEPLLQRMMLRATLEGLLEVPDAPSVPGFDSLAANIARLLAESNAQITQPLRAAWYRTPLAPLLSEHFARCRAALRDSVAFHTRTAARILARPDPAPSTSLLWACLHRLRDTRTGARLTPQQLYPEVGMYTTAGFDTTASTLGWCLYAAALHPGHQQALLAELRQHGAFDPDCFATRTTRTRTRRPQEQVVRQQQQQQQQPGGEAEEPPAGDQEEEEEEELELDAARCPGPEELARLPLLNAFVWEVMRLFPTAGLSAERVSPSQPVRLPGGQVLPPGVMLWVPMYGIHVGGHLWERAEEFRPERWLEDPHCAFAKGGQPGGCGEGGEGGEGSKGGGKGGEGGPAAGAGAGAGAFENTQRTAPSQGESGAAAAPRRFLPFGEGPKNCVGQNFGAAVVRCVFALLLRRYRLELHPDMMRELRGVQLPAAGAATTEAANGESSSSDSGCLVPELAARTAALTQVAVATKLRNLRLVLSRREE